MSAIDTYCKKLDLHQRQELLRIRDIAKHIVPEAEEVISYAMPTMKYKGHSFLGFDAHKEHIGIYPYGGTVIEKLHRELSAYPCSKGAIRIPYEAPIPEELLTKIIQTKLAEFT